MPFGPDIHGNLPALEAAVAEAKARGAGKIVCAGDMTGYGPFPDEVCRFLEERRIPAIIGNYDQKVIDVAKQGRSAAARMKPKKRKILLWTVAHLGDRTRGTLASLPDHLTLRVPFVKRIGGVLVVNCGSTGHPVDGDPRPAYALVHAGQGAAPRGRMVRFGYDRNRTMRPCGAAPCPARTSAYAGRGSPSTGCPADPQFTTRTPTTRFTKGMWVCPHTRRSGRALPSFDSRPRPVMLG